MKLGFSWNLNIFSAEKRTVGGYELILSAIYLLIKH